jgi:hypothetical protein
VDNVPSSVVVGQGPRFLMIASVEGVRSGDEAQLFALERKLR